MDVNHIHKARYSIQLSVVSIYACLKKGHKASNSILPLFSWVEEHSSSIHMFKYWMQIMKFQIDNLVLIRSMGEGNFKLFVKILMSLVIWFFIFDYHNYAIWLSMHIQEFERGNFVVQISSREFLWIHYDQAHKQSNKTIKSIKGPIDFVNRASNELQRRWKIAGPEIAKYLEQVKSKILKRYQQKWNPLPWG